MPNPELAVIQFYALTVYPHIVRSMFGVMQRPLFGMSGEPASRPANSSM